MPTQNNDTTPKKRASEPHIDNNAQTNKNNAAIPVFLLQEILTFEQAVAYLDAYPRNNRFLNKESCDKITIDRTRH